MIGPITYTYEELVAHKEAGIPAAALEKLRCDADKILTEPIIDVTQRTIHAPTGDPKDYTSIGPYWWPNPDTPNGLPYVNRDGQVNPERNQPAAPGMVYSRIKTLAYAAFYLGDPEKKYSEYAERQLYAWYINPKTRMNPNARYAQSIPGVCDGRSTGLHDFNAVHILLNAVGILECMGLLSEETIRGVREWYSEFLDWLVTSEQVLDAAVCDVNSGSWYDAHVITLARATGRNALARNIAKTSYEKRIKKQIMPDGSQPGELVRAGALGYCFYNFTAFTVIAEVARIMGINDYWQIDANRGVCVMKQAIDYLYPMIKNPETRTCSEIHPEVQGKNLAKALRIVDKYFPNMGYDKRAMEFEIPEDDDVYLRPIGS